MAITEIAKHVTELIYKGYGSDTGYLFGLEPDKKPVVEAIVQCTLYFYFTAEMKIDCK